MNLELLIVITNLLVVLASLAVAFVTMEDIVKDDNKTVQQAIRAMVKMQRKEESGN